MPEIKHVKIKDLKTHPEPHVKPIELAEYWDVHPDTVYRAIQKGSLPAKRVGRSLRVQREHAIQFERTDGQGTD